MQLIGHNNIDCTFIFNSNTIIYNLNNLERILNCKFFGYLKARKKLMKWLNEKPYERLLGNFVDDIISQFSVGNKIWKAAIL